MSMNSPISRIANYVCAIILIAVLVLSFISTCTFAEETLSLQTMVWFPEEHKDFFKDIEATYEGFDLNSVVNFVFPQMILAVVGTILCVKKGPNPFVSIIPVIFGVFGIIGHVTQPIIALSSMSVIMFVLDIVAVVIGLASAVIGIIMCERV